MYILFSVRGPAQYKFLKDFLLVLQNENNTDHLIHSATVRNQY